MATFKDKIKELENSHAYLLGAEYFSDESKECPFEYGSSDWSEWYEGYCDAQFLHRMIHDE